MDHSDTASASRIAELEQELAAMNHELESVLYSISHDLRAPLMAIGGFADLLLDQPANLDETQLRYLQRIREGNVKLTRLLDGLLRLSRIGREPLDRQVVDLALIAREKLKKLHAGIPTRTVELEAPTSLAAVGDPIQLGALLDALLENAWKFTGTTADARITLGQRDADGAYFVKDNGVGFESRHQEKLFRPLQRLHSEKQFPGIGIGLAIAAKIVQLHAGKIWAEGSVDHGATIYFTLAETNKPA
jgi:light-regulated signal transduction histidine kinase (bacteriophytochrome)